MKSRNLYSSQDYLCNEFSLTVNWLQSWVNDLICRQEDTVQYLLQLNLALRWNVQFKLHRSVQVVTSFPAFILFINPTNLYILLFLYNFALGHNINLFIQCTSVTLATILSHQGTLPTAASSNIVSKCIFYLNRFSHIYKFEITLFNQLFNKIEVKV